MLSDCTQYVILFYFILFFLDLNNKLHLWLLWVHSFLHKWLFLQPQPLHSCPQQHDVYVKSVVTQAGLHKPRMSTFVHLPPLNTFAGHDDMLNAFNPVTAFHQGNVHVACEDQDHLQQRDLHMLTQSLLP